MSDAGGPHGQSLGLLKCSNKTELGEKVSISFSGEHGSASFLMDKESAEYFALDAHYHFLATHP